MMEGSGGPHPTPPHIYAPHTQTQKTIKTAKPESISMTAPVVMSGAAMQFVMPAKYTSLEQLPVPNNPAVKLK